MQVHFGIDGLIPEWTQCVGCIGTFDGVHLGHQAVIAHAVRLAAEREQPCALITFDRHPAAILHPQGCPQAIASLAHNLRQFESLGVAVTLVLAFDENLSQTSAELFLERILIGAIRCGDVVVGHDFAFGKDRKGTPEWLASRLEVESIPPFEIGGKRVSSSAIRFAVSEGQVDEAMRLLGRPFAVEGVVVAGQRLGRQLGFPTINLARSFNQVTPADGIYAGVCRTSLGSYPAAVSVGVRPAVGGGPRTIEAYLLDYGGASLYGQSVELDLHTRLREERQFDTLDELKAQIANDVKAVANVIRV